MLLLSFAGCVVSPEDDPAAPEITTIAHAGETVTTDAANYAAEAPMTITWAGMPNTGWDWWAIRAAGAPNDNASIVRWNYTGSAAGMTTVLAPGTGGNYVVRLYAGNYVPVAEAAFTVAGVPQPSISTDKSLYVVDETIAITFTDLPNDPYTWITVVPQGSPAGTSQPRWTYAGAVSGTKSFSGIGTPGGYEARAMFGNTIVATTSFTIIAVSSSITTSKTTYAPDESITVSWTDAPTDPYTWVALHAAGAAANSSTIIRWNYTGSQPNGSLTFAGISTPGSYEARLYQPGTYNILDTTLFTVGDVMGGGCTPGGTAPVVSGIQTGELVISAAQGRNSVALTAPLASSILFTSTRESEPSPNYGAVMCRLHDAETVDDSGVQVMIPAGITCVRNAVGTDAGSGTITVRYSVATFSSGVTVQRGVANTGPANPASIPMSVNTASSFVLLNGMVNSGSGWGSNEFVRASLTGSALEIRNAVSGTTTSWQVVTMDGASVQRGTTSLGSGATTQNVTIAAAPTGSMALASYTTSNSTGIAASSMMLRTTLTNPTTLSFARSASGSSLDVAWEVVSLPFATYTGTASFNAGQTSQSVPVSGANFVGASSVAFSSTQSIFGQSGGSSSYAGALVDLVGEAAFTLAAGANSVQIDRASSQAAAQVTWTVIDFAHNCAGL